MKVRQHRITKTAENQSSPHQRSQMTKTGNQNMPVGRQCVLWANIPVTDCSEGAYTSEKVAQNHEVVRKICEWADNQDQISAVLTMRLESLCERGARVFRIKVMNSFFDVRLEFLRSGIRVMERAANVFTSTKVSQPSRRFGGESRGASRSNRPI